MNYQVSSKLSEAWSCVPRAHNEVEKGGQSAMCCGEGKHEASGSPEQALEHGLPDSAGTPEPEKGDGQSQRAERHWPACIWGTGGELQGAGRPVRERGLRCSILGLDVALHHAVGPPVLSGFQSAHRAPQ